jgi:hypothetical protein
MCWSHHKRPISIVTGTSSSSQSLFRGQSLRETLKNLSPRHRNRVPGQTLQGQLLGRRQGPNRLHRSGRKEQTGRYDAGRDSRRTSAAARAGGQGVSPTSGNIVRALHAPHFARLACRLLNHIVRIAQALETHPPTAVGEVRIVGDIEVNAVFAGSCNLLAISAAMNPMLTPCHYFLPRTNSLICF